MILIKVERISNHEILVNCQRNQLHLLPLCQDKYDITWNGSGHGNKKKKKIKELEKPKEEEDDNEEEETK